MSQVHDAPLSSEVVTEIEKLLVEEGVVSEAQVERARRIAGRMQKPRPVAEVLVELGNLTRADHARIVQLQRSRLSLVEILRDDGKLDAVGLAAYEQMRAAMPDRSDRYLLVEQGLLGERDFLQALSLKHDIPYVEPEVSLIDRALLERTSIPYLRRQKVLPLRVVDETLHAILADPQDERLIEELRGIFGMPVVPCCAPRDKILEVLGTLDHLDEGSGSEHIVDMQYLELETPEGSDSGEEAIRIVDYLLYRSVELGASDLHVEPQATQIHVRVRVDGVLRKLTDLPIEFAPRIASRFKVLAGCDIAEKRQHQDGRIYVKIQGHEIDVRVSSYVSMYGETLVMRILDRQRGLIPLDRLGFQPRVLGLLMDVILRASSGLILITGPTGSGKTSTLYSFVDYVKDESEKVITCEDPVEYVLDGIIQCSVNEKTGPTFADSLRAIVRQDPDIIVVGEIRNEVTAELAIEAALTGHKVLSTFHTEDSVGAVVRLLEMGVEPFLVSSTLSCIVAQRLARKMCDSCREEAEPSKRDLRFLGLTREQIRGLPIEQGAGCPECEEAGYRGRIGIHELLWPNDDFRDAIMRRAPTTELRAMARRLPGFLTLQEDGVLKVLNGRTTLSEIAENVPRDAHPRPLEVLREIASRRRST